MKKYIIIALVLFLCIFAVVSCDDGQRLATANKTIKIVSTENPDIYGYIEIPDGLSSIPVKKLFAKTFYLSNGQEATLNAYYGKKKSVQFVVKLTNFDTYTTYLISNNTSQYSTAMPMAYEVKAGSVYYFRPLNPDE